MVVSQIASLRYLETFFLSSILLSATPAYSDYTSLQPDALKDQTWNGKYTGFYIKGQFDRMLFNLEFKHKHITHPDLQQCHNPDISKLLDAYEASIE